MKLTHYQKFTTPAAQEIISSAVDPISFTVLGLVCVEADDRVTKITLTEGELADYNRLYNAEDERIEGTATGLSQANRLIDHLRLKAGLVNDGFANHPFNETETIELFEFARVALADADTFYEIAEKCDLSDEYLRGLRDKLVSFMDTQNG